ncbi:DNA/RNA non-specific endonuclease [Nonomuraea sp. NPDC049028]|uniref:DNA/RNA non-specific endonuclease n=1 Tax=Nonomuraea sp. NPDC049028 TaxID=3364348 RepID=UPI00371C8EEB
MATRQKSGGGQQRFAYAGLDNDIVAITDQNGATQAKYGRDPSGGLVSTQEGGGPALGVMTDIHDDLIGTFSGTALASTTAYNPYGEVTAQTGTQPRLGYQSEYTDPDTGKTNMHAGWYQPSTGTFTSRDSWTLEPNPSARMNRYGYGQSSPLIHTDPSGHGPDPVCRYFPGSILCNPGVTDDDVCKDGAGRTNTCNPGKCAEFSNGCRIPHTDSGSGVKPEKVKKPKSTKVSVTSQPNSTVKPTGYKPTGNPVKHPDPKHPGSKHLGPKSPAFEYGPIIHKHNCGKKCMIEGHPAKDDEEILIIVVGIDSIAQPVGLDSADFVELPEDRPTTEPAPTPDPEPEPENPPPGGEPEPDCEPFKRYDTDPVGRPIVGSARYCRPTDLDGGEDASVDPRYWPSNNPPHPHRPRINLYDRCHVVAGKLLGGSGDDPDNLVPCIATVNRGPMRRVENTARRTVQEVNGRGVVDYRVEVKYDGRNTIPSRFRMVTSIDGETVSDECIHNDLNKTVTDGYTC